MLRRHVEGARRRRGWWLLACGGVGTGVGLGGLVALALTGVRAATPPAVAVTAAAPPATVVVAPPPLVVVVPAPAPVVAPAMVAPPDPAPAPFGDLGPCPAPHQARPRGRLVQPPVGDVVVGVAGAPTDSRWVATWTADHVFVSRDGGASWDRVLDGPGRVLDASFDCHGRVLVLRDVADPTGALGADGGADGGAGVGAGAGASVGVGVRHGAREVWRAVPGVALRRPDDEQPRYPARLAGGGRAIAVVGGRGDEDGEAVAAVSDDAGASWRHVELGWYDGVRLAATWDDETLRVAVPWTDCMSEGLRLVTVTARGARSEEIAEYASQLVLEGGTLHAVSWECPATAGDRGEGLCAWRHGRGWRPVAVPASTADDPPELVLIEGPVPVAVLGERFHTVGARLGRARAWPPGAAPLATDRAGRLWGLQDGELIRR